MPTCVEIRLLGPLLVLEAPGDSIAPRPLPRSANARRLLVTLSLEPGPHLRSEWSSDWSASSLQRWRWSRCPSWQRDPTRRRTPRAARRRRLRAL